MHNSILAQSTVPSPLLIRISLRRHATYSLPSTLHLLLSRKPDVFWETPPFLHELLLCEGDLLVLLASALPLETHAEPFLSCGVVLGLGGVDDHAVVHGAVLGAAGVRDGESSAEGAVGEGCWVVR